MRPVLFAGLLAGCIVPLTGGTAYVKYLGGSGADRAFGSATDEAGNVWLAGVTTSQDFPVKNALQPKFAGGAADAFVAKLDSAGNVLWATYLGGSAQDDGVRVEIDRKGNVYVIGLTRSSDFPTTPDAFQRTLKGTSDAFLVKISPEGDRILYSTLFGGTGDESAPALLVDATGAVAMAGSTDAPDLPTTENAVSRTNRGGAEAYIAIFDASLRLTYATYFGGSGDDTLNGIALGQSGNIYFTGQTASPDFPVTSNAPQKTMAGKGDAYLVRLSTDKRAVDFASYWGGSETDTGADVLVDFSETAYLTGNTSSPNFPVIPAGVTPYHGGESDIFMVQFSFLRPERQGFASLQQAQTEGRVLGLLNVEAKDGPVAAGLIDIELSWLGGGSGRDTTGRSRLAGISVDMTLNSTDWDHTVDPAKKCEFGQSAGGLNTWSVGYEGDNAYFCCFGQKLQTTVIAGNPFGYVLAGWANADIQSGTDLVSEQAIVVFYTTDAPGQGTLDLSNNQYFEDSGKAGDPISTATGEVFDDEVDLALGGPLPLAFIRHYGSNLQTARLSRSALGANWSHNFDLFVLFDQPRTQAFVVLAGGKVVPFRQSGNSWVLQFSLPVKYQFASDAPGYRMFDPAEGITYAFDTGGRITRIEDLNGNAIIVTPGSSGPTKVRDDLGRTLDFAYSGAQLVRVTDHTGRSVEFGYTGTSLTSATHADGRQTSYQYTAAGTRTNLLTRRVLPESNVPLTNEYNAQGRLIRQTDSRGNSLTLAYNTPAARITQITDPAGAVTLHRHTTFNTVVDETDPDGKVTSLEHDFHGHRTGEMDRDGAIAGRVFDEIGNIVASAAQDGATTQYTYKQFSAGAFTYERLASVIYPDGTVESYAYDSRGNPTGVTDRARQTWSYTYTSKGLPASVRTPAGGTGSAEYNPDGTPSSITLLTGETIRFEYDALRRPIRLIRGDSTSVRYAYDARDRLISFTDGRGKVTTFTYDGNGRRTAVKDALQNASLAAYDRDNRRITATDAVNNAWKYAYDPVGRLSSITDPTGIAEQISYDRPGRVQSVGDAAGTLASLARSPEGVVMGVTNGAGQTWRIESDVRKRPTAISDPAGNTTRVAYDSMNRVTATRDALGKEQTFSYDPAGRLQKAVGRAGETVTFHYDADSRVSQVTDPRGNPWKVTRDGAGRVTSATDPAGLATRYEYNSRGLVSRIIHPDSTTAGFTYDENGQLVRELYSDGTQIDYTRDSLGRITRANGVTLVYDAAGRIVESNGLRNEYDAAGRLTAVFYDATRSIRYAYNNRGRLTAITDWTGRKWEYEYDSALRRTRSRGPNGVNSTYAYGVDGRMLSVRHAGADFDITTTYQRDGNGRITSVTGDVPAVPLPASVDEYSYSSNLRIEGREYDGRGNTTRDGDRRFTWNARNELTRAISGSRESVFEYDAFGYPIRIGDIRYVWNYGTRPPSLAMAYPASMPRQLASSADGVSEPETISFVVTDMEAPLTGPSIASINQSDALQTFYVTSGQELRAGPDGKLVLRVAYPPLGEPVIVNGGAPSIPLFNTPGGSIIIPPGMKLEFGLNPDANHALTLVDTQSWGNWKAADDIQTSLSFRDGVQATRHVRVQPAEDLSGSPSQTSVSDPEWRAISQGDFNGDGTPDIVFKEESSDLAQWYLNGSPPLRLTQNAIDDPNWRVISQGDFAGDSTQDLLFQEGSDDLATWYLNGVNVGTAGSAFLSAGSPSGRPSSSHSTAATTFALPASGVPSPFTTEPRPFVDVARTIFERTHYTEEKPDFVGWTLLVSNPILVDITRTAWLSLPPPPPDSILKYIAGTVNVN